MKPSEHGLAPQWWWRPAAEPAEEFLRESESCAKLSIKRLTTKVSSTQIHFHPPKNEQAVSFLLFCLTNGALCLLLVAQRADAARGKRKAKDDLCRRMPPFAAQHAPRIACHEDYNIKTRSFSQFAPHFRGRAPHFSGTAPRFPTRASSLARKVPGIVLPNGASARSLPRFPRRTAPPLFGFSPFATQHGGKGHSPFGKSFIFFGAKAFANKTFFVDLQHQASK